MTSIHKNPSIVTTRHSHRAKKGIGMRYFGKLGFQLFLVAQFFSLSRQFFFARFGSSLADVATAAGIGSLVLLPVVVFAYGGFTKSLSGHLHRGARIWLVLLLLTTSILSLYGSIGKGYAFSAVIKDFGPYLIVMTCVILGSIPEFWDDLLPTFLFLSLLGLIINVWGMRDVNDLLLRYGYETRVAGDLLAYNTRAVMELWPVLLLTIPRWSRRNYILILSIAIFVLIQQILFQKRLPVAEVSIYLIVFLFVLPRLADRWKGYAPGPGGALIRRWFLVFLVLVISIAVIFAPRIISGQTLGLIDRYSQQDTSRVGEAVGMLEDLHSYEYLIGRGMGGYFKYIDPRNFEWGTYLPDVGEIGKRTTHVGILMPMLKGGIILMFVYYIGVIQAWKSRRGYLDDPLTFAAVIIVIVKILVALQGGYLLMAGSFEGILFGLCLGRILSSNRGLVETAETSSNKILIQRGALKKRSLKQLV